MTVPARPLGLSSYLLASPFSDADLSRFADVKAMGYDIVEVCMEDPAKLTATTVASAAANEGLSVLVCGAFGPDRDLSHESREQRLKGIDYVRRCVDFAAAVKSPVVSGPMYAPTGQARLPDASARAPQWARACDSIARVAEYAAGLGVRLAVEPLNRFETDLVNTVEQGLQLCEEVGASNVGLLFDTFHSNIEEKSIPAAIRAVNQRLFHFHASENDRGAAGSGHIDWAGIAQAMRDVDYQGAVVVESFLPTVEGIARAVSMWRPFAASAEALAQDSRSFLRLLFG